MITSRVLGSNSISLSPGFVATGEEYYGSEHAPFISYTIYPLPRLQAVLLVRPLYLPVADPAKQDSLTCLERAFFGHVFYQGDATLLTLLFFQN